MSTALNSLKVIRGLIAFINSYTVKSADNLTDAVKDLKAESERGFDLLRKVVNGTVEALSAKDLGNITKLGSNLFKGNTSLVYFEFPETVTEIGGSCFYNCNNLVSYSLPEGITALADNIFYYTKVAFTKLPDGLTSIGTNVFSGCTELRINEIPAGVRSIGRGAFSGCTSIESITFKGTPSSIDRSVFNNCTNLAVINVPWAEGAVANAPWAATNAVVNYNCKV